MTNLTKKLSFLLVLQLIIAVGIFSVEENANNQQPTHLLTDFTAKEIGKVVISDSENSVTLSKQEDQWRVEGLKNLPAAPTKIADFLDKLANLKTGWPVATTESSHKRFGVTQENFQRRVQVFTDDTPVAEVLLGTSPGFKKVHARLTNQDEVYSVSLNNYDLPAKANDWLNKSLLAASNIERITSNDVVVTKKEDKWQFETPQKTDANLALDHSKAEELVTFLSSLSVNEVAEVNSPVITSSVEVETTTGKLLYQFSRVDDNHYVKRDDIDATFKINSADYEKIAEKNLPDFALEETSAEESNEQDSDPSNS